MDLGMANMSSGIVAVQWIPIIRTVLFLIVFAILPYLILFMPTPIGGKILTAIIGMIFILSMWTIIDAFLYRLIMIYSYLAMEDIRNYNLGTFSVMHFATASLKTLSMLEKSRWAGLMFAVAIGGIIIPLGSSALAMFAGSMTSGADMTGQQGAETMKEGGVSSMISQQAVQPQKTYEGVEMAGGAGNYAKTMAGGGAVNARIARQTAGEIGTDGMVSGGVQRNIGFASKGVETEHGLLSNSSLDARNGRAVLSSELSSVITNQADAGYWQGRFSEMDRRNGTHFADEIGVGKSLSVTEGGNGAIVSASVSSGAQSQEYGTFQDANGHQWTGTRMTTGDTTTFKGTREDGFVGTATQDKSGVHLEDVAQGTSTKGYQASAQLSNGEIAEFKGGSGQTQNGITSISGGTASIGGETYALKSATVGSDGKVIDFEAKSDEKFDSSKYESSAGLAKIRDELSASNEGGRFDNAISGLNQRIEQGQGGVASIKRSADGSIQGIAIGGSSLVSQQSDTNQLAEKGTIMPQSTALQQATTGNAGMFQALAEASDKGNMKDIHAQEMLLADSYANQMSKIRKDSGRNTDSSEVRASGDIGAFGIGVGGGMSASSADISEYNRNYEHFLGSVDNARTKAESSGLQGNQKAEFINSMMTADFNNQVSDATGTTHFGSGAYKQVIDKGVDLMSSSNNPPNSNYERPRQPGEPGGTSHASSPTTEERAESMKKFEDWVMKGVRDGGKS